MLIHILMALQKDINIRKAISSMKIKEQRDITYPPINTIPINDTFGMIALV